MELLQNASREGSIDGIYAAIRGDPQILSVIDNIPFVDTPLHVAASGGHTRFAMEIVRLKPSFATKLDVNGWTPIHIAMKNGYMQMALYLVETDPSLVRVKGREGFTPLHLAVLAAHGLLLKMFLSVCPESIQDATVGGETALCLALKYDNFEAFILLLGMLHKGTNQVTNDWKRRVLNFRDLKGFSVLHISASNNQLQATKVLEAYSKSNPGMLEVDIRNKSQQTARDIAVLHQHHQILQLLDQIEAASHVNPTPDTDEIYSWHDYFKLDIKNSSPDKIRTDLLVLAVLMATATFQAILTPPGGTDDKTGISRLSKYYLVMFLIFNTAGFFTSQFMLGVLVSSYPMYAALVVAMIAMSIAYAVAMASITPPGNLQIVPTLITYLIPLAIVFAAFGLRKYIKIRK